MVAGSNPARGIFWGSDAHVLRHDGHTAGMDGAQVPLVQLGRMSAYGAATPNQFGKLRNLPQINSARSKLTPNQFGKVQKLPLVRRFGSIAA